jgi:predicted TIM-barrel fold metal-dependent hydrolase
MTSQTAAEPTIDPDLPIVDAHHHLCFVPEAALVGMEGQDSVTARALAPTHGRHAHYLFCELMADLTSSHNVHASVFVDAHAMYRANGPEVMKSVADVDLVNGVYAMAANGTFGDVKVCAGIVGNVDLRQNDAVDELLIAHLQAGGGRYRAVREADRCMLESNYPVDSATCAYPVLWNVLKRLAAGASKDEKTTHFSGTAMRFCRLDI